MASSIDSDHKIRKSIKKILKANLNTIFLSVPKTVNNFGYGKEKHFASFLRIAYINDLSVHAWFSNGRRLGRKQHVNFNDKDEQQAQITWISYFLKKYNKYLDGVHLDYIRIEKGAPVNSIVMNGIINTISGIRETMKKKFPDKFLTATSFPVPAAIIRPYNYSFIWNQDVPDWYKKWIKHNPNSQYVVSKRGQKRVGTPAFMIYQQEPITWIKQGLIDAVIPMQYTIVDKKWNDEIAQFRSFFKYNSINDKYLIAALGWVPKRDKRSLRGYDAPGIVRKIKMGRKSNLQGFFIFILSNHDHDDSPLINALTIPGNANNFDPPFLKPAISLISRFKRPQKE